MSKPPTGVRADAGQSHRSLEKVAAHVREQLKIAPDAAINPSELFEDLHDLSVERGDGTTVPLRSGVIALEDSEGYTRYDRERKLIEILASERTYGWLEERHPRGAYFLAHELGHCILHTEQLIRLAQMPTNQQAAFHRGRTGHKAFEDTEWQANAFASALLMPARGIASLEQERGQIDAYVIAQQFHVSFEAAGYRLSLFQTKRGELLR